MKFILSLAFSLTLSSSLLANEWEDKGWTHNDKKDGIDSYFKSIEGSDVIGVGGEAMIDAPIEKIIYLLKDNEHKSSWMDHHKKTVNLEEASEFESIMLSDIELPFPLSNREFLVESSITLSEDEKGVIMSIKSVDHPKAAEPKSGSVRGKIVYGYYLLVPMGEKTFIKAEYLADPKGSLPLFLVNMTQKSWIYKNISAIREEVKKDYVKSWSGYEKLREKISH